MPEVVTIEERYGNAVEASDLTLRFERGGPVDVLIAAGMVGAKHPMCLSVWRWIYGGDNHERHTVLVGLVNWMRWQSTRRKWNKCRDLVQVTVTVADWYQHRICQACGGTRYMVIEGTPTLSDIPCPVCHGSGEHSLDKMLVGYGSEWIARGHELRAYLDGLVGEAAGKMLQKTANVIRESGP